MRVLAGGIGWYRGENRTIRFALLASVALHVLLLYAFPGLRESQRWSVAREPLIARLLQPHVQPVSIPAPAIPEARQPDRASAVKRPPRPRVVPESATPPPVPQIASAKPDLPKTGSAAATAATLVAPTPSTLAAAAPPTTSAAAAASTVQPLAASAAPQSAPAPEEALDAGTLAQYRLAIISAARRFKRYPRAALDNTWQGRVEIRMAIGATGAIAVLSVRSSTGHPVLDQQALEMVERAKATAQIPPALRGKEFTVDIPVIFSLKEPNA